MTKILNENDKTKLEQDPALSPEFLKVKQRITRLMLISIAIMFISIFAVLTVVVNKLRHSNVSAKEIEISIPYKAKIIHQQLDGDLLIIELKLEDGTKRDIIYNHKLHKTISIINFTEETRIPFN